MSALRKEPRKYSRVENERSFLNCENAQVDETFSKLFLTFKFSRKSPDYFCFCENVCKKNNFLQYQLNFSNFFAFLFPSYIYFCENFRANISAKKKYFLVCC
jgi:hypothetical protein